VQFDNGEATLYVDDRQGPEPAIVFVHGSWDDHTTWDGCVEALEGRHRTVTFDRRGHSRSTAPARQGRIGEDVDDLACILRHVGTPSVVVGHSYGATVCLITTIEHPDLVRGAVVHEPPLFGTLKGLPEHAELFDRVAASMSRAAASIEKGDLDAGAEMFFDDVAFGPGTWRALSAEHRDMLLSNASTWLDQSRDPDRLAFPPSRLATSQRPIRLTRGDRSPAIYGPSLDIVLALAPNIVSTTIAGAGHDAPLTHPRQIAVVIEALIASDVDP
jgi:pimeloyl-ACP methyl ester carboxylesterase